MLFLPSLTQNAGALPVLVATGVPFYAIYVAVAGATGMTGMAIAVPHY